MTQIRTHKNLQIPKKAVGGQGGRGGGGRAENGDIIDMLSSRWRRGAVLAAPLNMPRYYAIITLPGGVCHCLWMLRVKEGQIGWVRKGGALWVWLHVKDVQGGALQGRRTLAGANGGDRVL